MTDFAQAGDFEGVLTDDIGVTRPVLHSNPQTMVRTYEVSCGSSSAQRIDDAAVIPGHVPVTLIPGKCRLSPLVRGHFSGNVPRLLIV